MTDRPNKRYRYWFMAKLANAVMFLVVWLCAIALCLGAWIFAIRGCVRLVCE